MTNIVGDIAIQVGADIAPLITNLGKAQGSVVTFGKAAESAASGPMRRMATVAGAIAGAAVAASLGLAALTKSAVDNIGALNDAAKATGLHVSQLQAMQQVAEEASVSSESLTKAVIKMQDSIGGAARGMKAPTDALAALGLAVADLAGQSPDEQFARLADAVSRIEDPAARAEAAIGVFGRTGADLIPMMNGYRDAVRDAAAYQEQFGIAVSEVDAAKVDAIGDSLDRLAGTAQGVGTQLAVMFSDEIQTAIDAAAHSLEGWLIIFEKIKDAATTDDTERLAASMDDVATAATGAAARAEELAFMLEDSSDPSISAELQNQADSIRMMNDSFQAGMMTADEYKRRLAGAVEKITELIKRGGEAENIDMSEPISEMERYAESIGKALGVVLGLVDAQGKMSITGTATAGGPGSDGNLRPDAGGSTGGGVSAGYAAGVVVNIGSTGGGSGGGSSGGGRNLKSELDSLRESLATEAEAANAAYAERLAALQEFREQELLTQQEYNDLAQRAQKEHQDKMSAIDAWRYGDAQQKTAAFFGVMQTALENGNERMAKTARIFGAAEALINAWRAFSQTIADPTLPFFAKLSAGAAVLSAGMGAVNAIKSGGKGGASSSGGGAAAVASTIAAAQQSPLQVSISGFAASDMISGAMLSSLFDKLKSEAGDRGVQFV